MKNTDDNVSGHYQMRKKKKDSIPICSSDALLHQALKQFRGIGAVALIAVCFEIQIFTLKCATVKLEFNAYSTLISKHTAAGDNGGKTWPDIN